MYPVVFCLRDRGAQARTLNFWKWNRRNSVDVYERTGIETQHTHTHTLVIDGHCVGNGFPAIKAVLKQWWCSDHHVQLHRLYTAQL